MQDFWQRRSVLEAPQPIERRTHIALADTLRVSAKVGWWWSHVPSGEYRTEKTGGLLKRMGLKPGMTDFLLISPHGVHHWLELKRGSSPLTHAQCEFGIMCCDRGIPWYCARSYKDAVDQLTRWGAL